MQYIDSQNIDCKPFDSQSIILSILDNSSHYIDNNTANIRHFDSHYIDIFFRGSHKYEKKLYPLCKHYWPKCPKSIVIIDIITNEVLTIDILH